MNISKSIRLALAEKHMNQADLAVKLGCKSPNVSIICSTGRTRTETLKRIADAFEMKVSSFIALGED